MASRYRLLSQCSLAPVSEIHAIFNWTIYFLIDFKLYCQSGFGYTLEFSSQTINDLSRAVVYILRDARGVTDVKSNGRV